jgi:hypothetical protein
MVADLLNGLGYSAVEPVAPGGGPDSGKDIKFRDGDMPGIALVTINKDIRGKFKQDLEKQPHAEGIIALFCNVIVTPSTKLQFTRDALAMGYRLEIYDLERLRSILDTSQREVRRRYLHIDDEISTRLRSEVAKLTRFPDAVPDDINPPTILERLLADVLPRRLFELLLKYEEADIKELPGLGDALHHHLIGYYAFRTEATRVENKMIQKVGSVVGVRFPVAWRIYARYCLMRFAGANAELIQSWGDFLNYGITWEDAEKVFARLSADEEIASSIAKVLEQHAMLAKQIQNIDSNH